MASILVIEDDVTFSRILESFLSKNQHEVTHCHTVKEAHKILTQDRFDLVLLDYRLPDGIGMDVLSFLHKTGNTVPVIIMTSFHDIRTAVKTVKLGAFDYITKPVIPEELLMIVKEAIQDEKQSDTQQTTKKVEVSEMIVGESTVAQQTQTHIELVAPTELSVIIQGESGTGKERAARQIHQLSKRADKQFVAIDCGALSSELAASELFGHMKGAFTGALTDKKGQFEIADGGTLFLDEVGNLSYEIQVKLLRALQEKEIQPLGSGKTQKINVRIITATNDDLLNSVKEGKFREDLYHRLNEFKIQLPALKDRLEDLPLFIDHFIRLSNIELQKSVKGVSEDVFHLFHRYDWPGNLRELKNIIKRAVLLSPGDWIEITAIPEEMVAAIEFSSTVGTGLKEQQSLSEKELIEEVLRKTRYNKAKAAKLLQINRTTLYYKMAKYNIKG